MTEWQFICLMYIGMGVWGVALMVHDTYEFVVDEWRAWRLRRLVRKLYWFINWR